MRLDLLTYSGLLAIGLGGSYWASLPESKKDESVQALFNIPASSIGEINYEFSGNTVRLAKNSDAGRFWVTFAKAAKPAQAAKSSKTPIEDDPHGHDHGEAEGEQEEVSQPAIPAQPAVTEEFVAGDGLEKLLSSFAPFEVLRSLGKVSTDRLAEFGLKEGAGQFSIQSKDSDKKFSFMIGGSSYGSRNVFIMNLETSEVYLAKQDAFDQMRNANTRLYERKILDLTPEDVHEATIIALGKTKVLDHSKRNEAGEPVWTVVGSEGSSKASFQSWMDKLDKLRVLSFANKEQLASLEVVEPVFEVQYAAGGKRLDGIAVKKIADVAKGKDEIASAYFVRSDFLGAWAKVNVGRMESMEKDLGSIFE